MPCSRTGSWSAAVAERGTMAESCLTARVLRKPCRSDEGDEAAGNAASRCRAFGRSHDDVQELLTTVADRDHEPSPLLQLLVERERELGGRSRDGDRAERCVLGETVDAVA